MKMAHVLVWDIETIPDISGFAAANNLLDQTAVEVRAAMGDKFPKHIYHSIICIGALIAHQDADHWVVDALGAPQAPHDPPASAGLPQLGNHPNVES
jgi:predicted PolB exonuclease-like 3'-5' exonuclease